ncbi:MAG: phospholipid carrier-dependent glycosyltransferase [Bacteroidota bacterium]
MINSLPSKSIFYLFLIIGIILRFLQFGNIPTGLHGDEASIGYEAFSLLKTGNDRWGFHLPAYFLSWGSGQNTLYGYLSIPFVYLFGLNEFSVRLLSGVLGILCVPMVYKLCIGLFKNENLARIAAILYIFDPFLFMTSRWGDEFNIVPFFVILFLLLLSQALLIVNKNEVLSIKEKATLILVFPAMVLLFYAYAPSLFIVPLFIFLVLMFFWKSFLKQIKWFGFSAFLGLILISPFLLFILKNNILKHELAIESSLPFSLPLMLSPRERIFIGIGENLAIIKQNMFFVFSGFTDLYVWIYNTTHFRVSHFFVLFLIPAIIYLGIVFKTNKSDVRNILLLWAVASFSIFFLYHVNLNRSLHFQSTVPIIVAVGLFAVFEKIKEGTFKRLILMGAAVFFVLQASAFFGEYFIKFPHYNVFPKDVKWALEIAEKNKKPNEKIALSKELVFNYLYPAFYSKYSPEAFQKEVKTDRTTGNVIVHSFGHYYMLGDVVNIPKTDNIEVINELSAEKSFIAMLHTNEQVPFFKNFKEEILIKDVNHDWRVVRYIQQTE